MKKTGLLILLVAVLAAVVMVASPARAGGWGWENPYPNGTRWDTPTTYPNGYGYYPNGYSGGFTGLIGLIPDLFFGDLIPRQREVWYEDSSGNRHWQRAGSRTKWEQPGWVGKPPAPSPATP